MSNVLIGICFAFLVMAPILGFSTRRPPRISRITLRIGHPPT